MLSKHNAAPAPKTHVGALIFFVLLSDLLNVVIMMPFKQLILKELPLDRRFHARTAQDKAKPP
jgi:hypothetical protein